MNQTEDFATKGINDFMFFPLFFGGSILFLTEIIYEHFPALASDDNWEVEQYFVLFYGSPKTDRPSNTSMLLKCLLLNISPSAPQCMTHSAVAQSNPGLKGQK